MKELFEDFKNKNNDNKIFVLDIPQKKLTAAVKSYGGGNINDNDVLLLVDDTVFGGAKEGVIITESQIISKELGSDRTAFDLHKIAEISLKGRTIIVNNFYQFTKINMPTKDSLKELVGLIKLLSIESQKNIFNNSKCLKLSQFDSEIYKKIRGLKEEYCDKIFLQMRDEIKESQEDNIASVINNEWGETCAVIDFSNDYSCKKCVVLMNEGIVWQEKQESSSNIMSYKSLSQADFETIREGFGIVNDRGDFSIVDGKIHSSEAVIQFIRDLTSWWMENIYEPTEGDMLEIWLNKNLPPLSEANMFRKIQAKLNSNDIAGAVLDEVSSFFEGFGRISEEQKNEYYRKEDARQFDKTMNKKLKKIQLAFVSLALHYPHIIQKIEPKIPQVILDRFSTHHVTLELLCIIHAHTFSLLSQHLGDKAANELLVTIMSPILEGFVNELESPIRTPKQKTLDDVFGSTMPSKLANEVGQLYKNRVWDYLRYQSAITQEVDSEIKDKIILDSIQSHCFNILCTASALKFDDGEALSDQDYEARFRMGSLIDSVTGASFGFEAVMLNYEQNLKNAIENYLVEFLSD